MKQFIGELGEIIAQMLVTHVTQFRHAQFQYAPNSKLSSYKRHTDINDSWVLCIQYQYTSLTIVTIKVALDFLEIFMRISNSHYSLSIIVFWVISYIKIVFSWRNLIVFITKLTISQIYPYNYILVISSPTYMYTILCAVLILQNGDITEQNQGGK